MLDVELHQKRMFAERSVHIVSGLAFFSPVCLTVCIVRIIVQMLCRIRLQPLLQIDLVLHNVALSIVRYYRIVAHVIGQTEVQIVQRCGEHVTWRRRSDHGTGDLIDGASNARVFGARVQLVHPGETAVADEFVLFWVLK